ncbi:MAG: hypothetical protein PV347_04195 [Rickettsiaceae bacterium]|nr:hypothetical protein [Rickettsiaceae bacterium]
MNVPFLSSYQHESRNRRDIVPSNSWMNNSVISWVKGLMSTESPALLTSRRHNSTTVTAVPEINTTVVNNTLILGILATSMFNKTQYKQPIHESLLSPRDQLMRSIDDSSRLLEESLQKAKEEGWGSPSTDVNEVKISDNKTGMWK